MQSFKLNSAIYCGKGALSHLSEIGYDKVFIVADPFTASSGLINYITEPLKKSSIAYTIYSEVRPDPSIDDVVCGVTALMKTMSPCIVSVGGGSAIDLTKCIRLFANRIDNSYFPKLIAIPTTSGTGSEVTSYAVITDKSKNVKHALTDDKLLPEEVILDVEMVKTVPAPIVADTGMDVITHALEAYVSINATPMSDMYCEKAVNICTKYLERSYKFAENKDEFARERMHLASNIAGAAFNAVSLGLNHGMAHQLGGQFHIPHGRANSILLPHIIAYNSGLSFKSSVDNSQSSGMFKYAEMAKHLGLCHQTSSYEAPAAVKSLINYIQGIQSRMNMPQKVRDAAKNLTREEYFAKIPEMTEAALSDRCTPTNPRTPTPKEVSAIFAEIW